MNKKKIILGTANVNTIYGLRKNKINIRQFNYLLNYANKKNVKIIDTSPSYSCSEQIIGNSKKKI